MLNYNPENINMKKYLKKNGDIEANFYENIDNNENLKRRHYYKESCAKKYLDLGEDYIKKR